MKQFAVFLLFIFLGLTSYGQSTQYHRLPVMGQPEALPDSYHRIDTVRYNTLPSHIKRLLTNGAGLFVTFKSNSSYIKAKWCVTESKALNNLTPIANKGLDLYIRNAEGKWQFAGVGRPGKTCSEYTLVENMDKSEKEFLLYLPLYDEVKDLEVGVADGARFAALPNPFNKKIIVYGTSIVHGASASRPGLAYPAQLSRNTGLNFINLGMSGSAKIEPQVADMLAGFGADLFVLDFVPNSTAEIVEERTASFIRTIRASHPETPVIVIQSIVRESGYWDKKIGERVEKQNRQIKIEFEKLHEAGDENLYFIEGKSLIGDDHEGTVDGTHPTDVGFSRMLEKIQPVVEEVLKKHGII
jgi:lysophospholipase L1-like esterase